MGKRIYWIGLLNICYVITLFLVSLSIPVSYSDSPLLPAGWSINIEGAKIVSEGACFYFNITNNSNSYLLTSSAGFAENNGTLFLNSTFPAGFSNDGYAEVTLKRNESCSYFFVAPENLSQSEEYVFHFDTHFKHYPLFLNTSQPRLLEAIDYKVTVVRLDFLAAFQNLGTGLIISVFINAVLVVLSIYLIRKRQQKSLRERTVEE